MRKKLVVILLSVGIIIFSGVTYIFYSSTYKKQEFNGSGEPSQNVVKFKAKLKEKPIKVENGDGYYLSFDNVKAIESNDDKELLVLNNGGILITEIPEGKEIMEGDTILVSVQRQFAISYSEPPQLLGNSVIDVQFN
ncbi:TPA: hypothetical protein ACNKKJ_002607 [Enterococcus faecalis]|uniref:hypothetical protein n=1 Tax=Enterococcus faecalis TaxID=1351 RepID=UPI001927A2B1|nr:hypothetical protein [Enterococcus faecalis]EJW9249095.1 hypothetical protein [Enterococcus faecalis]MEB7428498.1 hypothetical protein [Enterococcus faecalis]HBI1551678.1 hypothetical protein [Enterococcus faecalis]HBI1773119.1 hypothetical protein [Enterococcus faecalis]HBI1794804.1 hypothetical protein [Enterococcus faecalis]